MVLATVDPIDVINPQRNPAGVRVQVTPTQGRVRILLATSPTSDDFWYVDAEPGVGATLDGYLVRHTTHRAIFLEALDGPASGVRWTVEAR